MIHLFLFFPLFFLPFFLLPSSLINASLLETVHRGKATFYSATVLGHCSYPNPSSDLYVALASNLYASGSLCGSCIKVWPGEREEEDTSTHLILPVVDECPTCDPHQIDLSFTAFAHLASPTQGILQIHWRLVPCPLLAHPLTLSDPTSPSLEIHIHQDSTIHYLALRIAGSPLPVIRVDIAPAREGGAWSSLAHTPNNYWVAAHGLGSGPFSLRIAMVEQADRVIQINDIPLDPGHLVTRVIQTMGTDSIEIHSSSLAMDQLSHELIDAHQALLNHTALALGPATDLLRGHPDQAIHAASSRLPGESTAPKSLSSGPFSSPPHLLLLGLSVPLFLHHPFF